MLAAVTTALGAITAGSTYWTSPEVHRDLLAPHQYLDHLNVGGTILGVVPISASDFTPNEKPAGFLDEFFLGVRGFVKATSGVLAATWLERLWWDHVTALLADPTLAGLVIDLIPAGPRDTDDGEDVPFAQFAQPWKATALERF